MNLYDLIHMFFGCSVYVQVSVSVFFLFLKILNFRTKHAIKKKITLYEKVCFLKNIHIVRKHFFSSLGCKQII